MEISRIWALGKFATGRQYSRAGNFREIFLLAKISCYTVVGRHTRFLAKPFKVKSLQQNRTLSCEVLLLNKGVIY